MGGFSMKKGGKEVGPASTYAAPHDMSGKKGVDLSNSGYGKRSRSMSLDDLCVSVSNVSSSECPPPKTSGIQIRGTGCATKGKMARGPMA
jgi:hypothetical protein